LLAPAAIETNPLEYADVAMPQPRAAKCWCVSALAACAEQICTSLKEKLPPRKSPVIPGHQVVGVIDRQGENALRFAVGARVELPGCIRRTGLVNIAAPARKISATIRTFTGYSVDGGYAEYIVAPQDFVYVVPEGFPDEQAAPLLCAGNHRIPVRCGSLESKWERAWAFMVSVQRRTWRSSSEALGVEVFACTRDVRHQKLALELGAAVGRRHV